MGVFNNLVMYKQDEPQNSLQSIVPDLATELVVERGRHRADLQTAPGRQMARRQAVHRRRRQMHLRPAARQGQGQASPQPAQGVVPQPRGGHAPTAIDEAMFHLQRPQPAFVALLASGYSPIYPCHVPPREMRSHPIGTGPFKFVEFKPNEVDQGGAQPGLLEAGPALSRRHRIHDRAEPLDRDPGVCRRQVRYDLALSS